MNFRNYTQDAELQLEAGLVAIAADRAGQDAAAAPLVLDLGTGLVQADVVVDVSAIKVAVNDETYTVLMELSNDPTFAAGNIRTKVGLVLSAGGVKPGASTVADTTGRYIFTFDNEHRGTKFRYARLYVDVGGTLPTITLSAWVGQMSRV